MSKKRIYRNYNSTILRQRIKTIYFNKFFNIFMTTLHFGNLSYEQENYLKRKFWEQGTISAFKVKNIDDEIFFAPYCPLYFNIYDFCEKATVVNERGVRFFPKKELLVNKEIVLGWALPNHKPVKDVIAYYVDRITQVEMIINTNLELQKIPFIVGVDPVDKDKLEDVVSRILNDEIVISTDLEALQLIKSLQANAPYLVDKLQKHKVILENEALTFLGVDNSGNTEKATTIVLDEVNSNNVAINLQQDAFKSEIEAFCEKIREVLNYEISFELRQPKAEESAESRNRSETDYKTGEGSDEQ